MIQLSPACGLYFYMIGIRSIVDGEDMLFGRDMRVLIVGFSRPGQMGNYLVAAAQKLGLEHEIVDAERAEAGSRIVRSFYWRLCGKTPAHLARFGAEVLEKCAAMRPHVVLTTGRAPLDRSHVNALRKLGAKVINYSTDDPWNATQKSTWFLSALPNYDVIFTPRTANLGDWRRCYAREVHYMPFGYDPDVHRPWPADKPAGEPSDILFVGGCDADRLPVVGALVDAGFKLALFGGYWNRHHKTRPSWRGVADQDTIRAASLSARICLCLVRRANRDGHVMRSYEAAAIGGCILAEDTVDHRKLFGPEGQSARYFTTVPEMVHQAKLLAANVDARAHLTVRLRERMASRKDTYADRLATMLECSMKANSTGIRVGTP